jgi:DNA replication protein DnaC
MQTLGFDGMIKGIKDLQDNPESQALDHLEWLGLLLECEATSRQQKRFERRLRTAKLRQAASVEDVDYRAARGLDRGLFQKLATNDWIRKRRNLLITEPTGIGKVISLARLATKPAATICRQPITEPPACSRHSLWRAATDAMPTC